MAVLERPRRHWNDDLHREDLNASPNSSPSPSPSPGRLGTIGVMDLQLQVMAQVRLLIIWRVVTDVILWRNALATCVCEECASVRRSWM